MSQLLQWFGEQSEAVKLALIALAGSVSGGLFAIVNQWRKPVLNAAPTPAVNNTTPTAPRAADDPSLLMLSEMAAINASLAVLTAATKEGTEAVIGRSEGNIRILHQIEQLCDKLEENTREVIILSRELRQHDKGTMT